MNPFARCPVQVDCLDDCAWERAYMEPPGLYYDAEDDTQRR